MDINKENISRRILAEKLFNTCGGIFSKNSKIKNYQVRWDKNKFLIKVRTTGGLDMKQVLRPKTED